MSTTHPTLELVGDWSSPQLLVRLLITIDAAFQPTERGLVDEESGDRCELTWRPRDQAAPARFREGESPVRPSLDHELLEAVEAHKSVAVLTAPDHTGREAAKVLLRCGAALVDAGAVAVRCIDSGLAHAGETWQALARAVEQAAEDDDAHLEAEALYLAWVMPIVAAGADWRSRGMGLLDERDVIVTRDLHDAVALDVMEALCLGTLQGEPPPEGAVVRGTPSRPRLRLDAAPDPDPLDAPGHNPVGVLRLVPLDGL